MTLSLGSALIDLRWNARLGRNQPSGHQIQDFGRIFDFLTADVSFVCVFLDSENMYGTLALQVPVAKK